MTEAFLASLEAEIQRIAAYAKGEVGIAARHMETGRAVAVNDHTTYPLASSVKMATALAIFDMVDRGDLSLDQMVEVDPSEMNPHGPGGLGDQFFHRGISLSVYNHMEGMITRSCNTSTDVLFRLAGGTRGVADYLARIGLEDFECTRTMREALCVLHEMPLPPDDVSVVEALRGASQEVLDARTRTNAEFHHDQRDHARPSAMVELLRRLWQADGGVSENTSKVLVEIMLRGVLGQGRVEARLPFGIPFASKGGSGAGTCVDVGLLMLPEGRGTLAIAIFVKASVLDMPSRERVLADIARLVTDYFIITTAPGSHG